MNEESLIGEYERPKHWNDVVVEELDAIDTGLIEIKR
jgi:hypothetical protein